MPADPHHLDRFLTAQSPVYPHVLAELAVGHKRTHWIWFIFPQLRGLGSSPTAQHFAIAGRAEALAFLAHPVLGPRLRECTALTLATPPARSAEQIFAYPDHLKFHSSLTLFHAISATTNPVTTTAESPFAAALARFFAGRPDAATLALL